MNSIQQETVLAMARTSGKKAGKEAGGNPFSGDTGIEVYSAILEQLQAGDPEVYDRFNAPNLSGEYFGDIGDTDIFRDVGLPEAEWYEDGTEDTDGGITPFAAKILETWQEGVDAGFWEEVERICLEQVEEQLRQKTLGSLLEAEKYIREIRRYVEGDAKAWEGARDSFDDLSDCAQDAMDELDDHLHKMQA